MLLRLKPISLSGITVNRVEAPFSAAKSNALDDFLGRASEITQLIFGYLFAVSKSFLLDLTSFSSGSSRDCETIFSTRGTVTLIDDEYSRQGLVHGLVIPRPP